MAYPDEVARVSLLWSANQDDWPNELAVNTFWVYHRHYTGNGWDWSQAPQEIADDIAQKLVTHWSAISGTVGSGYQIHAVKCAKVDAAGKDEYVGEHSVSGGTLAGTGSSGVLPPEVACCLSLWGYSPGSFVTRPGTKRGRMYLPYIPQTACDSHGKVSTGYASDVLTGWGAFLNDVQGMHVGTSQAANDADYTRVVVVSKASATWTQVGLLTVDNHFDSQRRRQHQAPATRSSTPLNHAE